MRMIYNKASLDGVPLDTIPRVKVLKVSESQPKFSRDTLALGGRDGGILIRNARDSLAVKVEFAIRVRDDMQEWHRTLNEVRSWCGDGRLTVYSRPGQVLDVVCTGLPVPGKGIFDPLSIEFTALGWPYWRDADPVTIETDDTATRTMPGDRVPGIVDVSVTVGTGGADEITVGAGDDEITVTGDFDAGDVIDFGHDANGFLTIKQGAVSILASRTAESADDLRPLGRQDVTLTVEGGSAVFYLRGCYR